MAIKAQLFDERVLEKMEPELRDRILTSFQYGVLVAHEIELEDKRRLPVEENFKRLKDDLAKEYKVG